MVKVNKTPKKQTPVKQDEPDQDIFAALGLSPDVNTQRPVKTGTEGPSVESLLKQMTDLQARVERSEAANLALTQTVQTTVSTIKEPPALNFDGLPDPVVDAAGYARELNARIVNNLSAQQEYRNEQVRTQNAGSSKYEQLWDDFATKYEDAADDPDTIEIIAASIVKKAQRRGVDPERYMFGNRDKFMEDVYTEYARISGKTAGEEDEPATRTQANRQPQEEDDEDTGRTGGIFGGQESGGSLPPARAKGGDMLKDLQAIQMRTGFW